MVLCDSQFPRIRVDLFVLRAHGLLSSKDEDKEKDLKTGPRESSRTRTFLEDNNTAEIRQLSCAPDLTPIPP